MLKIALSRGKVSNNEEEADLCESCRIAHADMVSEWDNLVVGNFPPVSLQCYNVIGDSWI